MSKLLAVLERIAVALESQNTIMAAGEEGIQKQLDEQLKIVQRAQSHTSKSLEIVKRSHPGAEELPLTKPAQH